MSLISIIIPCFNQGNYLGQALDSVAVQSYNNWECIIINDGSTDRTEEIAQTYIANDNRFKYFSQVNSGLSNARNTGLSKAHGQYIQLLDADDLIESDKLNSVIDLYMSGFVSNKVVAYSSMRYFENASPEKLKILGRNDFIAHVELKQEDSIVSQQALIKSRNPFVISAPLYPAKLFREIGGFDEDLKALEDWDLHIRCAAAGYRFHHFYQVGSRTLIRLHDHSMMRDQRLLDENFSKINLKYFPADPTLSKGRPGTIKVLFSKIRTKLFKMANVFLNRKR